jgi:hypothetical protein
MFRVIFTPSGWPCCILGRCRCEVGKFSNSSGLAACTPCPAGWYQDNQGGTYCKACVVLVLVQARLVLPVPLSKRRASLAVLQCTSSLSCLSEL